MSSPDLTPWLLSTLARLLPADTRLDLHQGLWAQGLDSLGFTQLAAELSVHLGRPVSALDLWGHSSVEGLLRHLHGEAPAATTAPRPAERDEPIAIIGMACRFPGAASPAEFWDLLREGRDAIGPVPADRWPADWGGLARSEAEREAVGRGGWVEGVDAFDPEHFGISPREAEAMDPQQRLALELCAEALHDAGLSEASLRGSRTAVYAAAIWSDYAMLVDRAGLERVDQYAVTGWHHSILANRISYLYGLQGPSLTIDAACASSLVALHLAAQGLRRGESDMAIVAAVNLNLLPESALGVARFGALSPTGRCRTFDAGADGYVRGEGGGLVLLKPLGAALRDGDRVAAVLRGSAVNNDGASAGLTVPSASAQVRLLREACAAAGVQPDDLQMVEAHGTGTPIGDPIEASALGEALGRSRSRPLPIGSAKTQVGHLEGAAGMVGLFKVILALQHRTLPPSLHFQSPNPQIDLDALGLRVPTRAEPMGPGPLLAGVSSFGLGGTNGHVVVEAPPAAAPPVAAVEPAEGPVALLFPGQGAQWPGMARHLLATEPVFRQVILDCEPHVQRRLGWSLLGELLSPPDQSRLDRIDVSLPAIICFDLAMAALWRHRGLRPAAMLGHSTGEIAAACAAGALDLPDAMQVICAYARAIARVEGQGRMALVEGDWAELGQRLAGTGLSPAIWDSAKGVVIGGPAAAMEREMAALRAEGRVVRAVRIGVCPHTPTVAPLLAGLAAELEGIRPRPCAVPLYSELTGGPIEGERLDVSHWVRNFSEQALFSPALDALLQAGVRTFVDVGPHPTAARSAALNLRQAGLAGATLASQRRGAPGAEVFAASLAAVALQPSPPAVWPLLLTAPTPARLAQLAGALADRLANDADLADLCWTLNQRQAPQAERLGLVGTRRELVAALEAAAAGEEAPPALRHRAERRAPRLVFVFPGQGSQWLGMGRSLMAEEPAFRAALADCDAAIAAEAGWSVCAELRAAPEASRLGEIDVVQPVLFAIEVALAALWRAWGMEPDAVVGHSMGEVAAAVVAGALSLPDAAAVICRRSRLLRGVRGQGAMLLTELTLTEAEAAVAGEAGAVSVAACNGPRATVLAGDPAAIAAIAEGLTQRGVFCRPVQVDVASHSPQMEPLLPALGAQLRALQPRPCALPLRSTVVEGPVAGPELGAAYWCQNLRQPVRFAQAIAALAAEGPTIFLEMSPHPILTAAVEESLGAGSWSWPSLRRHQPERRSLLESLVRAAVLGRTPRWAALLPAGRAIALPAPVFSRRRLWIAEGARALPQPHPILGAALPLAEASGGWVVPGQLDPARLPWLGDHRVHGEVLFPGAALVDLALTAARHAGCPAVGLGRIDLTQALGGGACALQVRLLPHGAALSFAISSAEGLAWTRHAEGSLLRAGAAADPLDLPALQARLAGAERWSGAQHHARLRAAGIEHGPAFQGIEELWRGGGEALARAAFPALPTPTRGLSPAALDVCLQLSAALGPARPACVPTAIEGLVLRGAPPARGWIHARALPAAAPLRRTALRACDEAGAVWLEIEALHSQPLPAATGQDPFAEAVLVEEALTLPALPRAGAGAILTVGEPHRLDRLAAQAGGRRLIRLQPGPALERLGPDDYRVDLTDRGALITLLGQITAATPLAGLLHLLALDGPELERDPAALDLALRRSVLSATTLVAALLSLGLRHLPACALLLPADPRAALGGAGLRGLARCLRLEHPELPLRLLQIGPDDADLAAALAELSATDAETELVLAGGRRQGLRLVRSALPAAGGAPQPVAGRAVGLHAPEDRALASLRPRLLARRPLREGELRIGVEHAGINFLDVLTALGMYPTGAPGAPLGSECAGRVLEVGPGVSDFAVGDAVVALGDGLLSTEACVSAALTAPWPANLSSAEAAATPIAFLTAQVALEELARLEPGERVLIHAGAGGVGQAAIQLALGRGARVYATAGSPEKRALLQTMGVEAVSDSRSLRFVGELRAATGGAGMDVVINALAGELAQASLDLLGPDGRFIELGKRDAAADRPLSTRPFLQNLTYSLLDLRGMIARRPEAVGRRLRRLMARFARGELRPTRVEAWPLGRAAEAFTQMAAGAHTGRLALDLTDPAATVEGPAAGGPWTAGTLLITGGLGGLGLAAAERAVARGQRDLLLLGRSAPSPDAARRVAALQAAGARVEVVSADLADPAALPALLDRWPAALAPLSGLLHTAAVLDDRMAIDLDADSLARVWAGKARGAWNLHEATRHLPIDLFVLYSSAASLLGSPAQASYAAANAFIDALALARRAEGLPATAVQWGAFSEVGLAAASALRGQRIAARGFDPFRPEEGLDALERCLKAPPAVIGLLRFDPRRWVDFHPSQADTPRLSALVGAPRARSRWVEGLRGSPAQRLAALTERVRVETAAVLRAEPERLDLDQPFRSLGVDSLLSLELRNRLEALVGRPLSATLLYTWTTIPALAGHLLGLLGEVQPAPTAETPAAVAPTVVAPTAEPPAPAQVGPAAPTTTTRPAPIAAPTAPRAPIALVGMACRLPGGIASPEQLLASLEEGVDGVVRIPEARWPAAATATAGPGARWAGLIAGVDQFDPAFFGISPREAAQMDPQHRLLLELCWEALERAGIAPDQLQGSRTGVFLGLCNADYAHLIRRSGHSDDHTATGTLFSTAPGRISYLLGLVGPSLTVDTACSSSLAAVHLALRSLREGECDLALVGGANLLLDPLGMAQAAGLQALSPDGRCRSFDASANGFVRAEGGGIVVLARPEAVAARSLRPLALLRGSAMNQDGRSAGLTAPSQLAQEAMLRAALRDAALQPADLDLIETHGTGTSLGDPIELGALRAVLGSEEGPPCTLGALKSHLGHTEAAAGVAGLIKAVCCLQGERIPANLHFKTLNPRADLQGSRLEIAAATRPWPRGPRPRRAGVSSFGVSGTNVHLVLEEAPPASPPPAAPGALPLLLSAHSPQALAALAGAWLDRLAAGPAPLLDLAWTAALGRAQRPHRAVVLTTEKAAAQRHLRALARRADATGQVVGEAPAALRAAAERWVSGGEVDWRPFVAGGGPCLAPTAPFQRQRHWFDAIEASSAPTPDGNEGLARALTAQALGLRPEALALDQPLSALGLDSILAVSLRGAIEARLALRLPLETLLGGATVASIAAALDARQASEAPAAPAAPTPAAPPTRGVFLTGATGFLGAHLLVDLLEAQPGPVYCLVRAPDPAGARRRLAASQRHYTGGAAVDWARVVALPGDLAAPSLGLSAADWAALSGAVAVVLHNGALLDFIQPAAALAPANVGGTAEALRLARAAGAAFHLVSTVGVLGADHPTRQGRLLERPCPAGAPHIACGYTQTKAEAERLALAAAADGLPLTVYRPALITGSRRSGAWNLEDALCRILKACVQMGAAPDLDWELWAAPVESVSAELVALCTGRPACGEVFHLTGEHPLPFATLIAEMRDLGWPIEELPYCDWLEAIAAEGDTNALAPLLPWLRSAHPFVQLRYDSARRRAALGPRATPALTREDWQGYLRGLVQLGFLPPAPLPVASGADARAPYRMVQPRPL